MNCPKCGVEVNPEQVICVQCGIKLKTESNKSKGFGRGCLIGLVSSLVIIILFIVIVISASRSLYFGFVETISTEDAAITVKNISEAENIYYMANNRYTPNFSELNTYVPNAEVKGNTAITEYFTYTIDLPYIKTAKNDTAKEKYSFSYNLQTKEIECQGKKSICQDIKRSLSKEPTEYYEENVVIYKENAFPDENID